MALISRSLVVLVILLCTFLYSVDAHAWMSNPLPRGQYTDPKKRVDLEYAPTAGHDPNNPDIICRSDPPMPQSSWPSYNAGQKLNVTISFNARHPGDCFFYLTYDGDKPYSEMKWFKIFETHDCYTHDWNLVTIPSYLPTAAHAILRWEWYALHLMDMGRGHVEYFASCTDVKIVGNAGGQLPQPQVNIPGNLPVMNTTNYWDPYNGAPAFFTGPPVASLNGATMPPSNPTTRPTQPTQAATQAPTRTPSRPSQPTPAPTSRPTPAATQRPSQPTPAPTQRPSQPTPAPTQRPSQPTSSPTTRPSTTTGKPCRPKTKKAVNIN